MNCERLETRLVAYLDGKSSAAERREVEAHLAACAGCRARAGEFRAVSALLGEVPAAGPSPSFDARVRAAVAAEPPRGWAGLVQWGLPALRSAAALAVLAVLAAWVTMAPGPDARLAQNAPAGEQEFVMIRDLNVLEDYDVLSGFEVLSLLPPGSAESKREM